MNGFTLYNIAPTVKLWLILHTVGWVVKGEVGISSLATFKRLISPTNGLTHFYTEKQPGKYSTQLITYKQATSPNSPVSQCRSHMWTYFTCTINKMDIKPTQPYPYGKNYTLLYFNKD